LSHGNGRKNKTTSNQETDQLTHDTGFSFVLVPFYFQPLILPQEPSVLNIVIFLMDQDKIEVHKKSIPRKHPQPGGIATV
jgi:hypothetical protein